VGWPANHYVILFVGSISSSLSLDMIQLLKDCGLESKVHELAGGLSGGQKRKLRLAIGVVGDSKSMFTS